EHALIVNDAGDSKRVADRVGTSPVQGKGTVQGNDMAIVTNNDKEVPAPLAKNTVRFALPLEVIPEDMGTGDDEEAPEPEKNNKTVDVVPSNVDSTSLSITKSRELTLLPDSPSAKRHSLPSPPSPPTSIRLSV
ncbi:hypothetical protein BGZ50_008867, partial [Haplosporangium sp. Z 11]